MKVHPDDYYGATFFPSLLQGRMSARARGLIEKARDHAMSSPYVLYDWAILLP